MLLGTHVRSTAPLAQAAEVGAQIVQLHITNPQAWRPPRPRPDAEALRAGPIPVVVHAPYLINLASPDPVVRERSITMLRQVREIAGSIGAVGLVVHGGSTSGEPAELGCARWADALRRLDDEPGHHTPIWIENTAGRTTLARTADGIALLWEHVGGLGVGLVLDTCHAHAAGEPLPATADRLLRVTGRIDLVHANDSRDEAGSGRDRHEHLGHGRINPDALVETVRRSAAPTLIETPREGHEADLAWLRERLGPGPSRPPEVSASTS